MLLSSWTCRTPSGTAPTDAVPHLIAMSDLFTPEPKIVATSEHHTTPPYPGTDARAGNRMTRQQDPFTNSTDKGKPCQYLAHSCIVAAGGDRRRGHKTKLPFKLIVLEIILLTMPMLCTCTRQSRPHKRPYSLMYKMFSYHHCQRKGKCPYIYTV